jgi:hypothetical protein
VTCWGKKRGEEVDEIRGESQRVVAAVDAAGLDGGVIGGGTYVGRGGVSSKIGKLVIESIGEEAGSAVRERSRLKSSWERKRTVKGLSGGRALADETEHG